MRLGILTGGGDVPGLNASIKAVVTQGGVRGPPRGRAAARLGRTARGEPRRPTHDRGEHDRPAPRRGAHDRPDGRHLPAHLAHESGQGEAGRRTRLPDGGPHRRRAAGPHRPRGAGGGASGDRRPDPDRGRRHPLVRPADAPGGGARDRDPQDDGQRRPRHRLLHRLLHGGDAHRELRAPAAHERRFARAPRGGRGVRALQRRDLARLRVPRRRGPGDHLGGAVRDREARGSS